MMEINKKISKNTFSSKNEEVKDMYNELEWLKVTRLRQEGYGYKPIARMLNMDRRTVKKLSLMRQPPGNSRRRKRKSILDEYKSYIDLWLKDMPNLRATIIYNRIEKLDYKGSYPTLKRYVRRQKGKFLKEATIRFETLPGEQAQVDFTKVRVRYLDGAQESVSIYLLTLGFSRLKDADISDYQNRKALMYLMEKSFWKIKKVVKEVLFDNLKPVASKARTPSCDGELAEEWKRFEGYYGFKTRLSMVYRAQTKGKVEKPIDPIKRFIESNIFLNKKHLQEELQKEIKESNKRVHSTTKQTPEDRFKVEEIFLRPLPPKPYDFARLEKKRVSKDCFISVDGVRYSVPWEYAKETLQVRTTQREVQMFSPEGALITSFRKLSQNERKKYNFVVKKAHYQGLSGYKEAFSNFDKLNKMGFGPFLVAKDQIVEKRPLKVYQEAVI